MTIRHIFIALPLLAASAYAAAQDTPPRAKPEQKPEQKEQKAEQPRAAHGPALYMPTDVIGAQVANDKKERLGAIEDLVISTEGEIAYAVVSTGDKLHAVPWGMFKVAPDRVPDAKEGLLVLPVGKDRLEAAPAIDKAKWATMAGGQWLREVDTFYGADNPASKRATDAAMTGDPVIFKASNLKGMPIQNASGETVGTLKDFLVDPANARVGYVAVDVGKLVGSDKVVAMPWSTLKVVKPQDDKTMAKLTTDLGKDRLTGAPEYKGGKESFKEMSDPAFLERVHQHYGARPYWKRADEAKDGSTPPAKKPKG